MNALVSIARSVLSTSSVADPGQPAVAAVVVVADFVARVPLLVVADRADHAEADVLVELVAIAEAEREAHSGRCAPA